MAHSTGKETPCYFCPAGHMRSDTCRDHCERKHPSAVDEVAKGKTPMGFVWHLLDGHTDRVWATRAGGESIMTIGHCFVCHKFLEKDGYKTIELAVAAHSCKPRKQRSPRGSVASGKSSPVTPATMAAPVHGYVLTADKLETLYEISATNDKTGVRALRIEVDDDGNADIEATLDNMVEDLVSRARVENENKKLKAEIAKLREAAAATPAGGAGDDSISADDVWNHIIKMSRMSPIKSIVTELLENAKRRAAEDPETPVGEYFVIEVFSRCGDAMKRAKREAEEAAQLDRERAAASGESMRLTQQLMMTEKALARREAELSAALAELEAMKKAAAKAE